MSNSFKDNHNIKPLEPAHMNSPDSLNLSPPSLIYDRTSTGSSLSNESQNSNVINNKKKESNISESKDTSQSSKSSEESKKKGFIKSIWKSMFPKKEEKDNFDGPTLEFKYTIKKRIIARGSTGLIGLVSSNLDPNKVLVVKRFSKPKWREAYKDVEARVGNEYCISVALQHQNVIKVYDLVKDSNSHWCQIMEYCSGGDLCHIISNGILNKPEIECCFKQLLEGVKYLHSMGIAHCDIKPENLLMDSNCILKITDFGCSVSFCNGFNTPCDVVMGIRGSLPYMAPEMLTKTSDYELGYDARKIDVWSCAIVFLTLLNSSIPFAKAVPNNNEYKTFLDTRLDGKKSRVLEKLKSYNKSIILSMLEPNPKDRCNLNDVMQANWFINIDQCHYGQATNCFHQHFALDYRPSSN